jgi:hypothetical protein
MAKNRKTRKEKLRAGKRLASTPSPSTSRSPDTSSAIQENNAVFTFSEAAVASSPITSIKFPTHDSHLREDLLRTGVVTGAIILAEITLYLMLTKM